MFTGFVPLETMLLAGGALGPVAMLLGIVLYRQLADRLAQLPAATALPDLDARVSLKRQELEQLNHEIRLAHGQLGELEAQKSEAEHWRALVEEAKVDYERLGPMRDETARIERELATKREEIADLERQSASLRADQEELGARLPELQREAAHLEGTIEGAKADIERLQAERSEAQARAAQIRTELAEVAARLAGLRESEAGLHRMLAGMATVEAELQRNREAAALAAEELRRTQEQLEKARDQLNLLRREGSQLAEVLKSLKLDSENAEQRRRDLKAEIAALEASKRVLEGTIGGGAVEQPDEDALAELRERPSCFKDASPVRERTEEEALARLKAHLESVGLEFSDRTLEAFHTCLKIADISPLTVLAGISGTGKSELPRRYGEALGFDFLLVPVQPRWDGPQDLLGFYNYMERRFKATELVRALTRLDTLNWGELGDNYSERMLLVLLDEMNLARVEYYFSDFLSLLEIRRASPERARVDLDLGRERRGLRLEPNALFVGTMNEDESTQALSDKVLDRANLLRFTRPHRFAERAALGSGSPARGWLPKAVWDSWRRDPATLDQAQSEQLAKWIAELNPLLDRLGRPFGHRVQQAIVAYAANHPRTPGAKGGAGVAFVDQLELRILPKLRGLDTRNEDVAQGLDDLMTLLRRPELEDSALLAALERARAAELFAWPGVAREG